jgi:hypothetical protein
LPIVALIFRPGIRPRPGQDLKILRPRRHSKDVKKNVKGSGRDNIRMFKHSEELCGGFGERLSILRNRAEIPECNFEPSEGSSRIPGKLKISEKSRGS